MGGEDRAREYNEKLKSEIEARIEAERRMLARRRQDVEDCACKAGMFPTAGRRGVLFAAGSALLAVMGASLSGARAAAQRAPAGAVWRDVSDGKELERRLLGLPGIGEMKAKSIIAILGKRFGVDLPGMDKVMPNHPTLGDVDSADALAAYQAGKRAKKAALRAEKG